MKTSPSFCAAVCVILAVYSCQAQSYQEYLLKSKPVKLGRYNIRGLSTEQVYLSTHFGLGKIINPQDAQKFRGKLVVKVELIYSDFQLAESFSQPSLNKERISELKKLAPYLFYNTQAKWNIISQTDCRNEAEAKRLPHGFVITFMPEPTKEAVKKEIVEMKTFLKSDSLGRDTIITTCLPVVKVKRKFTGKYLPVLKSKKEKGILYDEAGIWNRRMQILVKTDTVIKCKKVKKFIPSARAWDYLNRHAHDSTVLNVLKRNKDWKDILFVVDVTGSMSPYSSQLLVWQKLNFNTGRARYFTFFNDGNDKADKNKRIGSTGGIYHCEVRTIDEVEIMAQKAMENGSGGDAPENDLEAVIDAIKKQPELNCIVLLADNLAAVRDMELLSKINKPVHVILCGTASGINPDYLNIAYATKGSIHTIEEDIDTLFKMNEGSKIHIGKGTYIINAGKFERVWEL